MKNLFKISAIILAITLVFSVVTVKAATTDVTYSADKTTVKPGDEITITIHATCDDGISCVGTNVDGTRTEVVYDEDILELVSISGKSDFSYWDMDNVILLGYMGVQDKTDCDVGAITFKVKEGVASGTTTVRIEGMVLHSLGSDDGFEIPDRSISITIGATSGDGNDGTNPDDGNNPINPDDGNDPTNPDDGNNPTNPDDGNDPTNPDDGNNPTNPDDGNDGANPDDGNNPTNPDDGNDGANPDDGNDPANPDDGNDPANPDDGNDGANPNGGNGSSNSNGGNSSTSGEKDKTTTSTKLPDTGAKTYTMIALIAVIAVASFVGYKKYTF